MKIASYINVSSFLSPKQLDRNFSQQQDLLASQEKVLKGNRQDKMVRDVHQYIQTLLGTMPEEEAQAYCRSASQLAYGHLDYLQKRWKYRPRVLTGDRAAEPSPSQPLFISPLRGHGKTPQRTSLGGDTPSYGRPTAVAVTAAVAEDPTFSIIGDINLDSF